MPPCANRQRPTSLPQQKHQPSLSPPLTTRTASPILAVAAAADGSRQAGRALGLFHFLNEPLIKAAAQFCLLLEADRIEPDDRRHKRITDHGRRHEHIGKPLYR